MVPGWPKRISARESPTIAGARGDVQHEGTFGTRTGHPGRGHPGRGGIGDEGTSTTTATSSTGDARSTPPGSPSFSSSLKGLGHNQIDSMANTAAWLFELEDCNVNPPPMRNGTSTKFWQPHLWSKPYRSGSLETSQSDDDDDVKIVEEVELEDERDALAELAQLIGM